MEFVYYYYTLFGTFSGVFLMFLVWLWSYIVIFRIVIFIYIYVRRKIFQSLQPHNSPLNCTGYANTN